MPEKDKLLARSIRQGLLQIVDAIERWLGMSPTTAEMRRKFREQE